MFNFIKNALGLNRYKGHDEAMIISCFFNPQNSPYRLAAFNRFYKSIKHLNHRIIECVIGDGEAQLQETQFITRVHTKNLLWHKESLLNKIIKDLPPEYRYVFWVDADVIFENKNWLVDGVQELHKNNIIQPFDYCVHLEKGEEEPSMAAYSYINQIMYFMNDAGGYKMSVLDKTRHENVWRSFCSNYAKQKLIAIDENYDVHGHVGFAWGARREVLDQVPLYDKALIGGADHIMAHAAAGHIPHKCITKSFTDDIDNINRWSKMFFLSVRGKIGYVPGTLFHIWHGDIKKREYLNRIKEFTPKSKTITKKDKNGLYITDHDDEYMRKYYASREAHEDDGFLESMVAGYVTNSTGMGTVIGGNPLGAALGDMLNDSENQQTKDSFEFGGGAGGGGGAGSHYDLDTDKQSSDTTSTNDDSGSGNFS